MGARDTVEKPVVLFDGVCNLCNQSVLFIIQRDPNAKFQFATLQSAWAREQMESHGADPNRLHSIILLKQNKLYERSRAALEVARGLNGLWPLLYIFVVVPPFVRNAAYDFIARNRYKWFGKKNECMIPTPELKARFID